MNVAVGGGSVLLRDGDGGVRKNAPRRIAESASGHVRPGNIAIDPTPRPGHHVQGSGVLVSPLSRARSRVRPRVMDIRKSTTGRRTGAAPGACTQMSLRHP